MEIKIRPHLAASAILLLAGCASNNGYQTESAVEQRILGMSKAQILLDLGSPTKKTLLDNSAESYKYESEVGGLTGGVCTLTVLFEANKPTQAKLVSADLPLVPISKGSCSKVIQSLRRPPVKSPEI